MAFLEVRTEGSRKGATDQETVGFTTSCEDSLSHVSSFFFSPFLSFPLLYVYLMGSKHSIQMFQIALIEYAERPNLPLSQWET